ncbi:MAG: 50S ribosomal protein L34e [Hadesarchaea archaeon]|nr:MAG: 50S ribosomal protein L34e [Hadesarchaea archaeon]TDA34571.1 MAG: 50S ribosomal protein L34e [Hadesarchaea archaeon]
MPARRLRTGAKRKVPVRLPGGRTRIRYEDRRGDFPRCRECGRPLPGSPRRAGSLPRSSRRANRPFSDLCSECSREALRSLVR